MNKELELFFEKLKNIPKDFTPTENYEKTLILPPSIVSYFKDCEEKNKMSDIKDFVIVDVGKIYGKTIYVSVIEIIRNNATMEVRERLSSAIWDDENNEPSTYIWSEGNFSCDCNRSDFFGDDDYDECSEGKYSVNLKNPVTGEIFYKEF